MSLTEGAVVLEGFWDLTAGQVTVVSGGWGARELQIRLSGGNTIYIQSNMSIRRVISYSI